MKKRQQKIVPNLWFNTEAEEAVAFYTSIFSQSSVHTTTRFQEVGVEIHQKEPGSVMTVDFELNGFRMVALNGGTHFCLNPSVSLFLVCDSIEEIDRYWNSLGAGGDIMMPLDTYDWSSRYGWLQDRYGLSWQLMLDEEAGNQGMISPVLFFTGESRGRAEEAMRFYTSIFEDSDIEGILHYGPDNPYAAGSVQHAEFRLLDQIFMAMDSGVENDFPFTEAFSFIVQCSNQEEIDFYWGRLSHEGDSRAQQCGWLKDRFGISWQIIPEGLDLIFNDPDPERASRAMVAILGMKKIDVNVLLRACRETEKF